MLSDPSKHRDDCFNGFLVLVVVLFSKLMALYCWHGGSSSCSELDLFLSLSLPLYIGIAGTCQLFMIRHIFQYINIYMSKIYFHVCLCISM